MAQLFFAATKFLAARADRADVLATVLRRCDELGLPADAKLLCVSAVDNDAAAAAALDRGRLLYAVQTMELAIKQRWKADCERDDSIVHAFNLAAFHGSLEWLEWWRDVAKLPMDCTDALISAFYGGSGRVVDWLLETRGRTYRYIDWKVDHEQPEGMVVRDNSLVEEFTESSLAFNAAHDVVARTHTGDPETLSNLDKLFSTVLSGIPSYDFDDENTWFPPLLFRAQNADVARLLVRHGADPARRLWLRFLAGLSDMDIFDHLQDPVAWCRHAVIHGSVLTQDQVAPEIEPIYANRAELLVFFLDDLESREGREAVRRVVYSHDYYLDRIKSPTWLRYLLDRDLLRSPQGFFSPIQGLLDLPPFHFGFHSFFDTHLQSTRHELFRSLRLAVARSDTPLKARDVAAAAELACRIGGAYYGFRGLVRLAMHLGGPPARKAVRVLSPGVYPWAVEDVKAVIYAGRWAERGCWGARAGEDGERRAGLPAEIVEMVAMKWWENEVVEE